jgi:N-formylglutamate deformylase
VTTVTGRGLPVPRMGEPVFEVQPGAPGSPVILHVPHSSRRIPPHVRERILLDDRALAAELELLTDQHTDRLAARAATVVAHSSDGPRPWLFRNRFSRLVVDPERFPDEREEMATVGMGAVYTRTAHGGRLREDDPAHAADLLASYYRPYAAGMTALVDERLAATGRAVVLDVHSYPELALPYELHGTAPRPEVCLGTDAAHTPADLIDAARVAFAACGSVGLDTPFAGCYVPLKHYGGNAAVTAVMIELRRDVYRSGSGFAAVVRALAALVEAADAMPR